MWPTGAGSKRRTQPEPRQTETTDSEAALASMAFSRGSDMCSGPADENIFTSNTTKVSGQWAVMDDFRLLNEKLWPTVSW